MDPDKPDYIIDHDRPVAVLYRKKGQEQTDRCPFCGSYHLHGISEGHRIPHCTESARRNQRLLVQITAEDGTILFLKDGYYIKHY